MRFGYMLGFAILVLVAGSFAVLTLTGKPYIPREQSPHIRGASNATVEIVEFSDFQCPYCGRVQPTLDQLMSDYDGKIRLRFRHYPLPIHANGQKAAEASECAADQGKFWELHDKMYSNQNNLYVSDLKRYAYELGLNRTAFDACLDSVVMAGRVGADKNEGNRLGVDGTPTFFVNGQKLTGAQSLSAFRFIIDQELRRA